MDGFIKDPTLDAMGAYMTRLSMRQQMVASNLANVDTPGYRAKDISFHATMEELISESSGSPRASRPGHLDQWSFVALQPGVFEVQGNSSRPDLNNVELDQEMMKLSETSFGYSMMALLLRTKFRTLANSISEGRGA